MRSDLCRPISAVSIPIGREGIQKWTVRVPTSLMDECDRFIQERAPNSGERRGESFKVTTALRCQRLTAGSQFAFPRHEIGIGGVLFQRRISLAQCKVIATPVRQESMFHVEHAPIEEPAPTSWALLKKFVNFRVDDLGGKLFRKVRNARGCGATHTPLDITARRTNPERYGPR